MSQLPPSQQGKAVAKERDEEDDDGMAPPPIQAEPDDIAKPPGLENVGASPPFGLLVKLLEFIQINARREKRPDKVKLLSEWFAYWRMVVGKDLYPLIRLLLPDRDNRRRNYSLKEAKLATVLVKALDLTKESDTAKALIRWKVPGGQSSTEERAAGEFATVAFDAIQPRSTVVTELGKFSIDDINEKLDELSKATLHRFDQSKKVAVSEAQARIMKTCVAKMTPLEMKWFIRIILRDLKVSISERTVFHAFHPDAMDYFNTCSDIMRVCWKLHDLSITLPNEEKDVSIFKAFKPMLAYRNQKDLGNIVKTMKKEYNTAYSTRQGPNDEANPFWCKSDEFLVEEKFDGERMQLHKRGDKFRYFSRKGTEYTHLYGDSFAKGSGSLTPFIEGSLRPEIIEIILDGEMLVWDPRIKKYVAFGTLKSFADKKEFGPMDPRPCFKVFDILYLHTTHGQRTLLTQPLFRRKQLLQQMFTPKPGVLEFAEMQKASTSVDLSNFLKRILVERGEGLVVKNPHSNYILNDRRQTWIKVKPDYMDELGECISGMVIGGYWGEGNRGGYHASFLIGLRDDTKPRVGGEPHYQSFAKVGTGFNASTYKWIGEKMRGKWFDFNKKDLPPFFSTIKEFPDQLIRPSDSFLVEVKAAEIVVGKDYACGMTLRFPRAKFTYKRPEEQSADTKIQKAFSLEDVHDLRSKPKRVVGEDLGGDKKKRMKTTAASTKPLYVSAPILDYKVVSDLFQGLKFYIHNLKHLDKSKPFVDKDAMQKLILEHGGDYGQRIPDDVDSRVIIASEWKGVDRKAGAKTADILLPDWVLESIQQGRQLPKTKRFYVKATPATEASEEYLGAEDGDAGAMLVDDGHDYEQDDDNEKQEYEVSAADKVYEDALDEQLRALNLRPVVEERTEENAQRAYRDELDRDALSSDDEPDTEDDDLVVSDGESSGVAPAPHQGSGVENVKAEVEGMALTDAKPGLGEQEGEFDVRGTGIFGSVVAYFDTSANAEKNGLVASSNVTGEQDRADSSLSRAREDFLAEGGHVTDDLHHPQLTHIIFYSGITDRMEQMVSETLEPRPRQVVTHDWVFDSRNEGAMEPENYFRH